MALFGCDYLETRGNFFVEYVCGRTKKQIDTRVAQEVCLSSRYYDCYDFKNAGACFITTAVCLTLGKPDDCEELTEMRRFRDEWLRQQPDGEALIEDYYKTAPGIVANVNKAENRRELWTAIYREYILPCVEFAKRREYEESKRIYVEMVATLKQQYA